MTKYGQLFEAFVVNELHRRLTYQGRQFKLSYLRVNEDLEIDIIIELGTNTHVVEFVFLGSEARFNIAK